mmetsp:Transcript_3138/g.19354  ORF Transcript_3138/g.19354 Transcript_3138/m.19354 type:complete len:136 (-) Transcript_3138:1412-1819(-)
MQVTDLVKVCRKKLHLNSKKKKLWVQHGKQRYLSKDKNQEFECPGLKKQLQSTPHSPLPIFSLVARRTSTIIPVVEHIHMCRKIPTVISQCMHGHHATTMSRVMFWRTRVLSVAVYVLSTLCPLGCEHLVEHSNQ